MNKTVLFLCLAMAFCFAAVERTFARECSLGYAKKAGKALAELQMKNNDSKDGKLSFLRGAKRFGFDTLEYTKEYLEEKITNGIMGDKRREALVVMLERLEKDSRLRIYRLKMRAKYGTGSCGHAAICVGYQYEVEAKNDRESKRCYIKSITDRDTLTD